MKDSFNHCCQHLRSSGYLGATEFTNHLRRLEKHCGLEEAISICSQIGNYFKRLLVDVEVDRPNCIRMKRYLLPSGRRSKRPALKLVREAYSCLNRIKLNGEVDFRSADAKKILALVNMKHCFKLKKPSVKMVDKFNSLINYKVDDEIINSNSQIVKYGVLRTEYMYRSLTERAKPYVLSGPSICSYELRRTKSPVLNTDGTITSAPGYDPRARQLAPLFHWLATVEEGNAKSSLHLAMERIIGYKYVNDDGVFSYKHIFDGLKSSGGVPIRGKISHIMESGGKDRVVAQPFLVFQVLFEPLKSYLNSAQKLHPNIYTHDQSGGVDLGQSFLRYGRPLYCFDASGFTDRFPLKYQTQFLKHLGFEQWANLLQSFVEDGVWYDSHQQCYVKYAQGQPMGLGPSFALATLTHAAVVEGLYYKLNHRVPDRNTYAIVGDDIIITNKQLAEEYRRFMESSGVEINLSKSIISDHFGEFCGTLFTGWTKNVPFKPKGFKWQFPALVKALSFYGRSYYKHLDPRSKHVRLAKETLSYKGGDLHHTSILTFVKDVSNAVDDALAKLTLSSSIHTPDYSHLYEMTSQVMEMNRSQGLITPRPEIECKPTFYDIFRNRSSGQCYLEDFSRLQIENQLRSLKEELITIESLASHEILLEDDVSYLTEETKIVAERLLNLPVKFSLVESIVEVKPQLPDPDILAQQHREDFKKAPYLVELGESVFDTKPLPRDDLSDLSL